MEVNVGATFRTARAAIPYLRAAGPAGRIVTMASLAAHNGGGAGAAVYAASKAAIIALTKGLAKELAADGITANAVARGFIGGTAFHDTFTPSPMREAAISAIPLHRPGTAEEVAATVAWLAGESATFVTGATIDIDGGARYR